jgi:RsiW-degrading membrane proteinase PrsW (M82 family)
MNTPPAERLPDLAVLFPVRLWLRHPAVRAWTTWLFVALVAVPPAALALFSGASQLLGLSIVLAAYFAFVWFLVLRVVVGPRRVGGGLVTQVAAAEAVLVLVYLFGVAPSGIATQDNLLAVLAFVGLPEELLKALPVVAVALIHRRLHLAPRDMLFLAATSGLVFGAIEAVVYGYGMNDEAGVGLNLVWRFATDPISHALWAGVAGYFLGLATHFHRPGPWLALAGIGLGVPVVLHALNDWAPVNGTISWVIVQVLSALLFLAYARIGLVSAVPRRRPAEPIVPAQPWGPPAAAGRPLTVEQEAGSEPPPETGSPGPVLERCPAAR